MPAHVITRKFTFEAAHRLLHHPGKCRHLHGHSYKVSVVVSGKVGDKTGMAVDFADLKDTVGAWIERSLDHNIILNPDDPLVGLYYSAEHGEKVFAGRHPFIMPYGMMEPTAENLARIIAGIVEGCVRGLNTDGKMSGGRAVEVHVHETERCAASYLI